MVLDINDHALSESQDLEQLPAPRVPGLAPTEPDDDSGSGSKNDSRSGFEDAGLVDPLGSVEEDRPGLFRAVSARCVSPPEVPAGGASPLEGRVEQRYEWL